MGGGRAEINVRKRSILWENGIREGREMSSMEGKIITRRDFLRVAGVGSCLKNYIQFVPNRPAYHPEACSALGKIWTFPIVQGKTRLNILSVLTPQFYGRGANFFDKRYVWSYKGLIVGTDPVAVDAVGAHLLQVKRVAFFGEDREVDTPPLHISVADKEYHLGVSEL